MQGPAFGGAKIGILKFYTPNLAYCSQSTLMPSIRKSIGDLIAGAAAAIKTFAPGGKHLRTATDNILFDERRKCL